MKPVHSDRILVLGANGFIGRAVTERLIADRGPNAVVAGVKGSSSALAMRDVQVVRCDALDMASVMRAMAGATHAINCVAGSNATLAGSAATIADAATRAGLRGVVHLSSVAVYGRLQGHIDELCPTGTDISAYGEAKLAGETAMRRAAAQGLPAVILRPALVCGPGSEPWTARIARLLRAHRLGDLGTRGVGLCNLIDVDDVARGAIAALDVADTSAPVFNLAAPDPPTWNRYLVDLASLLGIEPVSISGSRFMIERLAAYPLRLIQIASDGKRRPSLEPIAPSLANLFDQSANYYSTRAATLLPGGWTDYQATLDRSARWLADILVDA